ncbi:MAG: SH3 domain-containing protein [Pseudorhodobacter sp.]
MFKLLMLLAAGMFVTLLIGGEDKGQMRQGLIGSPQEPAAQRPIVRTAGAEPEAEVVLARFNPVTVQKTAASPAKTSVIAGSFVIVEPEKTATIAAAVAPVVEAEPEASTELPIMYVSSRAVNVRMGPSTNDDIVGRLTRAEAVTLVSPIENGWARIRIEGDGIEGFIAARLLTDTDPSN